MKFHVLKYWSENKERIVTYEIREVSSTLLVEDVFEPELQRGLANKSETSNVLTSRIAHIILFTPIVIIMFDF